MLMKTMRKVAVGALVFVALYLAVAAAWAWASAGEAIAGYTGNAGAAGLSRSQAAILLKIEDPTFYGHAGLSLADGQGLTTISSSVARELYLSQGDLKGAKGALQRFYRGVFACCKKVDIGRDVMALVLDARLPKERQLAIYAAEAYMGSNRGQQVKGFAQAAQSYLGKPLGQLSDQEFARLAAMVKAPNQFHPSKNPSAYALRVKRVEAILSGACRPDGWFDTTYAHCAR